jgi:hypothetical protein
MAKEVNQINYYMDVDFKYIPISINLQLIELLFVIDYSLAKIRFLIEF